jgi:hypothetical protein
MLDQELADLTIRVRRMAQLQRQAVAELGTHHAMSHLLTSLREAGPEKAIVVALVAIHLLAVGQDDLPPLDTSVSTPPA